MGMSKAWLPWRESWALVEIGRALAERCDPLLLSKAAGQSLPPLPQSWRIIDDDEPQGGPLSALASACRALDDEALAGAIVATCDQSPEAVREATARLFDGAFESEKSRTSFDGERRQPFPGYYSASALRSITEQRRRGVTSMRAFLDSLGDGIETVRTEQPSSDWDDPKAYLAAASAAGFDPPAWCREAVSGRSGRA
jgi:molybdopterin-guanine dinucleotide biosynthesis protein A